jgi:hypothetical protein
VGETSSGPLSIKARRHLQPSRLAQWLVAWAAAMLPPQHRERYALELVAELYGLTRPRQVSYAVALLVHAPRLATALADVSPVGGDAPPARRDWRCRLGKHRYVVRRNPQSGAEAMTYLECRRCGKQKDIGGSVKGTMVM